jgi:hypothetical protein
MRESAEPGLAGEGKRAFHVGFERFGDPERSAEGRAQRERVQMASAPPVGGGEHPEAAAAPGAQVVAGCKPELDQRHRHQQQRRQAVPGLQNPGGGATTT